MKTRFVRFVGVLTLLAFALPSYAQTPNIAVRFKTIQIPGADRTDIFEVNRSNVVVGDYFLDGTGHGLVIAGGKVVNIDNDQNGSLTTCIGINSSGTIVGQYNNWYGDPQGFSYKDGAFTDIGPAGVVSAAYGINDAGNIVGYYLDSGGNQHGFLWDGQSYTTLDVPGATQSAAWGINNSGLITMFWSDSQGFTQGAVYDGSRFVTINVPGATSTYPHAINNHGDIVLSWEDSVGTLHGALFHGGRYYKFDDPKGLNGTEAFGINDKDIVVGRFQPTGNNFYQEGFAVIH